MVAAGESWSGGDPLTEGSIDPAELLLLRPDDVTGTETYIVSEVLRVYESQGVEINDKHIELIVRQMLKKVRVDSAGDTRFLPGQLADRARFLRENRRVEAEKGETAEAVQVILGITKASLATDSFLSAASFQETTKVLTDAAIEGKIDRLNGLKENVIIGKLIPASTGLKAYRKIEIGPGEGAELLRPRASAGRRGRADHGGLRLRGADVRPGRRVHIRRLRDRRRRTPATAGTPPTARRPPAASAPRATEPDRLGGAADPPRPPRGPPASPNGGKPHSLWPVGIRLASVRGGRRPDGVRRTGSPSMATRLGD